MPRAVISWSGGKDSCLALTRASRTLAVTDMLTMFDEAGARSRSHGLPPEVIAAHAARLGLAPSIARASWATYTEAFVAALQMVARRGVTHAVFGDIFEDAHREWTETVSARAGLTAVLPLWGESTTALTREFLDTGGQAQFVTVRTPPLDPDLLGASLSHADLDAFLAMGVDPGGERGEYHTVVTDSLLFTQPLELWHGRRVTVGGCQAIDVSVIA
jgi:uncharacterized protein (TIGR00290 family)